MNLHDDPVMCALMVRRTWMRAKELPSATIVAQALGCHVDELLSLSDEDCADLIWAYTETVPYDKVQVT